jgi:ABC-type phosphate/phosphonate transport system substrate-binding protein
MISHRFLRPLILVAALAAGLPAAAQELVFGVNEGVTYRITPHETRERYKELAEMLSKALKRPVKVVPEDNYVKLRKGLEDKTYDLAYVHPAHHSLRAIRDQKYQLVVITKGWDNYKARFLMKPDAPYKQPQDVLKTKMVMPDPDSITAWMARATIRDLGADPQKVDLGTTRYQDGIPFMMENGFYEVGITAAGGVVKEWQSKGGKILFESKPVPIKHVIASPALSPADVETIRQVFLSLENTKDGQEILKKIGFAGFRTGDGAQMAELTKWLGI